MDCPTAACPGRMGSSARLSERRPSRGVMSRFQEVGTFCISMWWQENVPETLNFSCCPLPTTPRLWSMKTCFSLHPQVHVITQLRTWGGKQPGIHVLARLCFGPTGCGQQGWTHQTALGLREGRPGWVVRSPAPSSRGGLFHDTAVFWISGFHP